MPTTLGKRLDEHGENFNRELESIKENNSEMKNTITEMKNTIEGIKIDQGTKILHATQCGQKKKYTHRIPILAPASATPLPPHLQDRYSHYFSPYLSCGSFCKKINQMYMFPFS